MRIIRMLKTYSKFNGNALDSSFKLPMFTSTMKEMKKLAEAEVAKEVAAADKQVS